MDATNTSQYEAERGVVGILLEYPKHAHEVFSELSDPRYFRDHKLRELFTAMLEIHKAGDTITQAGIKRHLERKYGNLPGWYAQTVTDAMGIGLAVPSAIGAYKSIILDSYHLERFRQEAKNVQTFDEAVELARKISDWNAGMTFDDEPAWPGVVDCFLEKQHRINEGEIEPGYSWGLPELDRNILIQPGKLYTIGGIKKGAKTLFLLSILDHNLRQNPPVPCMFFSIEMGAEDICRKLISKRSKLDSRTLHTKYVMYDYKQIEKAAFTLKTLPLTVNQSPDIGVHGIVSRAKRWKFKREIPDETGIVAVDFLQLIRHERSKGYSEASAIKEVAYELARLAKDLQVAVVALAQLRNEAEGQNPHLRYLEGSGGMAQASEAVILLDLVSRRTDEYREDGPAGVEEINVIIAAQRTGVSGISIACEADLRIGEFWAIAKHIENRAAKRLPF